MRIEVWVVKMPNGDRAYTSAMPPKKELLHKWCSQGGRVFRVWADFPDDPSTPCKATEGRWHGGGEELTPLPPPTENLIFRSEGSRFLYKGANFEPPDERPGWALVWRRPLTSEERTTVKED